MATAAGPNFLGIGAQKAGTSWLHEMLKLHPDVGLPKVKELHYWDSKRAKGMPLSEYETLFASMLQPIRGEITPGYAIIPSETIAVIRDRYPSLRLLYTLRNPLERAWSNAKMFLMLQKIVADETQVAQVEDSWYLEHFRTDLSLRRGDYRTCIENWLKHFERPQLLVSLYDDLLEDARGFLVRSCRHIGADAAVCGTFPDEVISRRVAPTAHPTIRPSLLPALLELYSDKVKDLSDYLGVDLVARWLDPYR